MVAGTSPLWRRYASYYHVPLHNNMEYNLLLHNVHTNEIANIRLFSLNCDHGLPHCIQNLSLKPNILDYLSCSVYIRKCFEVLQHGRCLYYWLLPCVETYSTYEWITYIIDHIVVPAEMRIVGIVRIDHSIMPYPHVYLIWIAEDNVQLDIVWRRGFS